MSHQAYQKGIELAKAGRCEEALTMFNASLRQWPNSGRCWNDAGAVLYRMGRLKEAANYFQRSRLQPDHPPQVYQNLIRCYVDSAQPDRALPLLESMRLENCLDEQAVIQISDAFHSQGENASALEVLLWGQDQLEPSFEMKNRIDKIKSGRAKIAFICGADGPAFLKDIVHYIQQRFPVRCFEGQTPKDVYQLMRWSDISWFEWCTELARIGTELPKVCHTIIRLHRYEAHLNWPKLIQWNNVDTLITVGNEWVIKSINHWVGNISRLTSVVTIPNGVDLNAIPFKNRTPGKKIAFVAKLRMVKNPMLLVQCMAELLKIDPEYKLYMAGEMHDLLLWQYLQHMTEELGIADSFIFEQWQNDIPSWLEDKSYLASTSVIESQGMGILEAMAAGIKPIIHNFPGASGIFGTEHLFNTPREFCRQILEKPYESEQYRSFVERRYPLTIQLRKINELLVRYEKKPLPTRQNDSSAGIAPFLNPVSMPV